MTTLKPGARGPVVKELQTLLNSRLIPSPRLGEDGDFGERTRDAVMQFQRTKGLVADGVVGPKTWTALGSKPLAQPLPVPPSAGSGPAWMQIAEAEVGVHEHALPGQHNQRIVEYHQTTTLKATADETPWCSSFVNWVITKAGYRGTNNALAKSWLDWGSKLETPRVGAIAVIKKKGASSDVATGSSTGFHVGFFVSTTAVHLRLLGGNQSDQVKYSSFSLTAYEVRGYRWPS